MFFINVTVVLGLATVDVVCDAVASGYDHLFPEKSKKGNKTEAGKGASERSASITALLSQADQNYQNLICKRIDPLLAGEKREKHLQELMNGEQRSLSSHEKHANRRFGVAVASVGLLGFIMLTGAPLLPLLYAGALYVKWPCFHLSYITLVKERRLGIVHTWAVFNAVMWLSGHYILGTFSGVFFSLYHKVRFITQIGARRNLINTFDLHTQTAWVLRDGMEIETPIERVSVGDTVVLNAGQLIPVDGFVTNGSALIDQHRLTGEAQAVEKKEGDSVYASSHLMAGRLWIRVEKAGSATAAAQILKILNRTVDDYGKDLSESMNDVEHTLWPILTSGAICWLVAGPAAGAAALGANYVFSMIHFKMLTMLNALNLCSEHSILIKDGRSLNSLSHIDILIFDKTGTLTLAQPRVVGVHTLSGRSENDILVLAATAEHRQTHPIALSILSAARERGLELHSTEGSHYEAGYGIKLKVDGRSVLVGSQRFMGMEKVEMPDAIAPEIARCQNHGISMVYVAEDGQLAGAIELDATLRPDAKQIVSELQESGVKVYIMSGDQEAPTRRLAHELGMDSYFANVLPAAKAELVRELQAGGRTKVGFIGDGINDAVALQEADVSISFRSATNVASDNAQIVLMNDNLQELRMLFKVARAFDKNVTANYNRSLALSVAGVSVALFLPNKFVFVQSMNISNLMIGYYTATRPLLNDQKEDEAQLDRVDREFEDNVVEVE